MASSVPDESSASTLDDDTESEAYEKDSQLLLGIFPPTVIIIYHLLIYGYVV